MIQIRPYSPDPQLTQAIIALILPIQQLEFELPVSIEVQSDLLDIPGFYQQNKGNFWLAFDGEEVVGTIALKDIGEQQAALRKMFVKASHRGNEYGVAKQLLNTLFEWCRQVEIREVYLGTSAKFLTAHRFYEKHEFKEVALESLPSNFFAMQIDTKFYRRSIYN
ncbi:MAG: GNAT family N-acetyltransferase [Gammaproteobacteria bacterium]|nr:GNAT family N-acetyltransferase [Gammaproteobacteria bacterium]